MRTLVRQFKKSNLTKEILFEVAVPPFRRMEDVLLALGSVVGGAVFGSICFLLVRTSWRLRSPPWPQRLSPWSAWRWDVGNAKSPRLTDADSSIPPAPYARHANFARNSSRQSSLGRAALLLENQKRREGQRRPPAQRAKDLWKLQKEADQHADQQRAVRSPEHQVHDEDDVECQVDELEGKRSSGVLATE